MRFSLWGWSSPCSLEFMSKVGSVIPCSNTPRWQKLQAWLKITKFAWCGCRLQWCCLFFLTISLEILPFTGPGITSAFFKFFFQLSAAYRNGIQHKQAADWHMHETCDQCLYGLIGGNASFQKLPFKQISVEHRAQDCLWFLSKPHNLCHWKEFSRVASPCLMKFCWEDTLSNEAQL